MCARVCVCVCFTIDLRSTHDVPIKPIAICYSGSSGLCVLLCEHLFPEHTHLFVSSIPEVCVCVCVGWKHAESKLGCNPLPVHSGSPNGGG